MNEIVEKKFKVNKIVFYMDDKEWGILGTTPIDDLGEYKLDLINDFSNVTITGQFSGVYEGVEMIVSGNIVENPKYGKQIQMTKYRALEETKTKEGIINFLAKSSIKGIGIQNAAKIYEAFGDQAISVVTETPEKLVSIFGIGSETLKKVIESSKEHKENKEFYSYIARLNIKKSVSDKILKALGKSAVAKMKSDPFILLELIPGVSFKQIDEIFLKQGGDPLDNKRLNLGLLHALKRLVTLEGSTGVVSRYLRKRFYEFLNLAPESDVYTKVARRLEKSNKIVMSEGALSGTLSGEVYYKEYLEIEKDIASKLVNLETYGIKASNIQEQIIKEEINNFTFTLNSQQVKAIHDCLNHNVSVLTGLGGSGKSSITKALYRIYERCGYSVHLLSPTAKACRRLEECTGGHAQTIHRFLGMTADGMFKKLETYEDNTVLIIDEASMVDIILFSNLLAGVSLTTKILLVGDNNQLPSVQAGNVLGDLISSDRIHVSLLTDIMRQKENSNIIKYCSMINNGEIMDPCDHDDFHYEEFGTSTELKEQLFPKYLEEVARCGLNEVQVIAPYKKGEVGMDNLNLMLQEIYQRELKGPEFIKPYRRGDRVRHTLNNYDFNVFNGETGIVVDYSDDSLIVDYGGKRIPYDEEMLEELTLSYASTVHSSQGSEYKVVFVILDDTSANSFLHIRRLLYTAVSRGKERVYIYTKPYLVDKCIMNSSYRPRITRLKQFLRVAKGEK